MNEETIQPKRRGRPPKQKPPEPHIKIEPELPSIEDAQPPKTEPETGQIGVFVQAVVQVSNPASQYYGILFIVGDVRAGKAHGFHMLAGGKKEFVTVGIEECFPIGVSKVRSKDPTSPQWKQEHKIL